ncbi:hypothetical protein GGI21_003140, partial [Coemansia aciculifera]
MQANGIGSLNINGSSSSSSGSPAQDGGASSNGQALAFSSMPRIDSTSDSNSAENGTAHTPPPAPQQEQPRRRLVQGRPTHGRVISDTNSDLSSASDDSVSDSDFGGYGKAKSNGRVQVGSKTPRASLPTPMPGAAAAASATVAPSKNQQAPVSRRPNYVENSSSGSGSLSPISDDADFTMSDAEGELDDDEDGAGNSDAFEDSSDGDWGDKTPRKRKTKKPAPASAAKGNKRAKGGSGASSRSGRQHELSAAQFGFAKGASKQRSAAYSDSGDDSDFLVSSKKSRKGGVTSTASAANAARGKPKKRAVPAYMGGSDSEYGSSDYRNVRQSTRDTVAVKSYADDDAEYPGVDFEDDLDSAAQRSKAQAGKGKVA